MTFTAILSFTNTPFPIYLFRFVVHIIFSFLLSTLLISCCCFLATKLWVLRHMRGNRKHCIQQVLRMVLPFRSCVHSIQLSLSVVIHVIFKIWLLNVKLLLMQVLFLHSFITVTWFVMEKTKYPGVGRFAAASYHRISLKLALYMAFKNTRQDKIQACTYSSWYFGSGWQILLLAMQKATLIFLWQKHNQISALVFLSHALPPCMWYLPFFP